MIAQAQSGTGKTATFAISILQQIDVEMKSTQALVLAPTRELAQQVGNHSTKHTPVWEEPIFIFACDSNVFCQFCISNEIKG